MTNKVYAIGFNPEDAIRNMLGRPTAPSTIELGAGTTAEPTEYAWEFSFTYRKAGFPTVLAVAKGNFFPGGAIIHEVLPYGNTTHLNLPFTEINWRVNAIGKTPENCVANFAKTRNMGPVTKMNNLETKEKTWYYSFQAGQVNYKASGWYVPGGCIMCWWK